VHLVIIPTLVRLFALNVRLVFNARTIRVAQLFILQQFLAQPLYGAGGTVPLLIRHSQLVGTQTLGIFAAIQFLLDMRQLVTVLGRWDSLHVLQVLMQLLGRVHASPVLLVFGVLELTGLPMRAIVHNLQLQLG
jgi:hypothetical protein